jgi:hypothetical protein
MGRNFTYCYLSASINKTCYLEKEEWKYCSLKIIALWNLIQWPFFSLDDPLEVCYTTFLVKITPYGGIRHMLGILLLVIFTTWLHIKENN